MPLEIGPLRPTSTWMNSILPYTIKLITNSIIRTGDAVNQVPISISIPSITFTPTDNKTQCYGHLSVHLVPQS